MSGAQNMLLMSKLSRRTLLTIVERAQWGSPMLAAAVAEIDRRRRRSRVLTAVGAVALYAVVLSVAIMIWG